MLYLVKTIIDRNALAQCGDREAVMAAESARANEVKAEGRLLGIWRRADCGGSAFIVEADSHDTLNADLSSLPTFPYFTAIEVTPIVAHPAHPEFGVALRLTA